MLQGGCTQWIHKCTRGPAGADIAMFDLRSASANIPQHGVTQSELQEVDAADEIGSGHTPRVVWQRISTVLLVSAPPWLPAIVGAIDSISAGSRSVLFVVGPALALILILSCPPARGVIGLFAVEGVGRSAAFDQ